MLATLMFTAIKSVWWWKICFPYTKCRNHRL